MIGQLAPQNSIIKSQIASDEFHCHKNILKIYVY